MPWWLWLAAAVLVLLPFYVYILSKWAEVGRRSGARFFFKKFNDGDRDGKV